MIPGVVAGQMRRTQPVAGGFPEVVGSYAQASVGSQFSLEAPYIADAGDLVIMLLGVRRTLTASPVTPGEPSFSAPMAANEAAWLINDSLHTRVFTRTAAGSESGVTVTMPASYVMAAAVVVVRSGTHGGDYATARSATYGSVPALAAPWGAAKTLWVRALIRYPAPSADTYTWPAPDNQAFDKWYFSSTQGILSLACTESVDADSVPSALLVSPLSGSPSTAGWTIAIRPAP